MLKKLLKQIYFHHFPYLFELRRRQLLALRRRSIRGAFMGTGDAVIIFCCGVGNELPMVEKIIGPEGKIWAVDRSPELLVQAEEACRKNGWENVELINADVSSDFLTNDLKGAADVGICSLGLSIILDCDAAYLNLVRSVKAGGQVIVQDFQLASGVCAILNPISVALTTPFGGSWAGHQGCMETIVKMAAEMRHFRKEEHMAGTYFIAWGEKW